MPQLLSSLRLGLCPSESDPSEIVSMRRAENQSPVPSQMSDFRNDKSRPLFITQAVCVYVQKRKVYYYLIIMWIICLYFLFVAVFLFHFCNSLEFRYVICGQRNIALLFEHLHKSWCRPIFIACYVLTITFVIVISHQLKIIVKTESEKVSVIWY